MEAVDKLLDASGSVAEGGGDRLSPEQRAFTSVIAAEVLFSQGKYDEAARAAARTAMILGIATDGAQSEDPLAQVPGDRSDAADAEEPARPIAVARQSAPPLVLTQAQAANAVHAESLRLRALCSLYSGDPVRAMKYAERSHELHDSTFGPMHTATARLAMLVGSLHGEQSAFDRADVLQRQAMNVLLDPTAPVTPLDRVMVLSARGQTMFIRGDLDASEYWCRRAWDVAAETLHSESPVIAEIANGLGTTLYQRGDYEAAVPWYEQAVDRTLRYNGTTDALLANRLNNLAAVLAKTERYQEAEPLARRARDLWAESVDGDSAQVATASHNLAAILLKLDRIDDALAAQETAIAMNHRLFGPSSRQVAVGLCGRARILAAMGSLERAAIEYEAGMTELARHLDATNPMMIRYAAAWGFLLADVGRRDEAQSVLRDALNAADLLYRREFGRDPTSWAFYSDSLLLPDVATELAALDIASGVPVSAFGHLERARTRSMKHLLDWSWATGASINADFRSLGTAAS
ncbi:MAG: tetratricopeptide repeat protein, partial [Planctomycetota bacterium]